MKILFIGSCTHRSVYSVDALVAKSLAVRHAVTFVTSNQRQPIPGVRTLNVTDLSEARDDFPGLVGGDYDIAFAGSIGDLRYAHEWGALYQKPFVAQVLHVPLLEISHALDRERNVSTLTPQEFEARRTKVESETREKYFWERQMVLLGDAARLVVNVDATNKALERAARLLNVPSRFPQATKILHAIDTAMADAARPRRSPLDPFFVTAGRWHPYSGFEVATAAVTKMKRRLALIVPNEDYLGLEYWIDDPDERSLLAFFFNASDCVKFEVMKSSIGGVYTSLAVEIPSLVPTEFSYCGKRVVVSDLSVHRERTHALRGIEYVPRHDVQSVINALECIGTVPSRGFRHSFATRRRVVPKGDFASANRRFELGRVAFSFRL